MQVVKRALAPRLAARASVLAVSFAPFLMPSEIADLSGFSGTAWCRVASADHPLLAASSAGTAGEPIDLLAFADASIRIRTTSLRQSCGLRLAIPLKMPCVYVIELKTAVIRGGWSLGLGAASSIRSRWHAIPKGAAESRLRIEGVDTVELNLYSDDSDAELELSRLSIRVATPLDNEAKWGLSSREPIKASGGQREEVSPSTETKVLRADALLALNELVHRESERGADNVGYHRLSIGEDGTMGMSPATRVTGTCSTFAETLRSAAEALGVIARPVTLGTAAWADPVRHARHENDVHALVEALEPSTLRWILLDPTFNVHFEDAHGNMLGLRDLYALASEGKPWKVVPGSVVKPGRSHQDYYIPYESFLSYVYAPEFEGHPAVNPLGLSPQQVIQRAAGGQP